MADPNPWRALDRVAEQLQRQPVAPIFQAQPPVVPINRAKAVGPKAKNFVGGMAPQARARDRLRKEE